VIVARALQEVPSEKNSVVTVGTFDGIHLGHLSILLELTTHARERSGRSIVFTFDPHPREVVGKGGVRWLTTLEERIELLRGAGVDILLVIPFTFEFSRMSSREFFERYVVKGVGVSEVIVGYDHMFGRDREAGIHDLRLLGDEHRFGITVVDPVSLRGQIISSSRIRELLTHGDAERAGEYLGRPYALSGTVVKGEGRGAALGFATANVRPDHPHQLVPGNGVYCARVVVGGAGYGGMLNIGVRPTFTAGGERTIEVHLFNFEGTLYGERMRIEFLRKLRAERTFLSTELFIEQLHRDREECLRYLESEGGAR
jgi:riboflavin kinase/FMN adenylyltransferase